MLDIQNLDVNFRTGSVRGDAVIRAVNGVSLHLEKGDALGLVGESGSGKTTVGRTVLGLNHISAGQILFDGKSIADFSASAENDFRSRAQMVFQDPHSALNPRMTILRSVGEPLILHTQLRGAALRRRVSELLDIVGLQQQFLYRYPHELSGGQKQRVCIARAIALNPELLVLDEPSSGLDVSVRYDILSEVVRSIADSGRTILFSSHLLDEVERVTDNIIMINKGKKIIDGHVDKIKEEHYRYIVKFAEETAEVEEFLKSDPLLIRSLRQDAEWLVVAREPLPERIKSLGGKVLENPRTSLENVFMDYCSLENHHDR